MTRRIVAVSGGVDSVVLLDMLLKEAKGAQLVVAHFDHGIRADSAADARFVAALASSYGIPFETKREELGKEASEELARTQRYSFLRKVAKKYMTSTIVTAHHADDVIETIVINLKRGTGWRGLAVLDTAGIERPLIDMTKQEIYAYALRHDLEWVEDETNQSDVYLRNIIRKRLGGAMNDKRRMVRELRDKQTTLKRLIDNECKEIIDEKRQQKRYFFIMISEPTAIELLARLLAQDGLSATRPQRRYMLHMIKTARPGKVAEINSMVTVRFTTRHFAVNYQV